MKLIVFVMTLIVAQVSVAQSATLQLKFESSAPKTGVFFAVQGTPAGKPATLDQRDKQFTTSLVTLDKASNLVLKNSDSVDHNIYTNDRTNDIQFDVGLMSPGSEQVKKVDWVEDSIVRVGCKIHPKMRTYVANFNSAHYIALPFERGKKDYTVTLSGFPQDVTEFKLLMPGYRPTVFELASAGESTAELHKKSGVKGHAILSR